MSDKSIDPLVIFTPSGKRGRFPIGTPVLTAARQLGVDLDSVCGGRGICSKCQITPSYGEFPKHGVTVDENALSEWNKVEQRYKDKRGLLDGRRLGCQAPRPPGIFPNQGWRAGQGAQALPGTCGFAATAFG